MKTQIVNDYLEGFYKLFNEIEELSLRQGIKELTKTELHVIEAIGDVPLFMNELSDKLGITMGTATVAIKKLEIKGYIERNRSNEDRRKVKVNLNDQGMEAYSYHTNFHKKIIQEITSNLSEQELDNFVEIFQKILVNLKNEVYLSTPRELLSFEAGEKLMVIKIKGSPAIQNYFGGYGVKPLKKITVTQKTKEKINILCNKQDLEISLVDAANINCIKV